MPTKVAKKVAQKTGQKTGQKPPPRPTPPSTGFWLLKSEPESYSIDAFARDGKTLWTGVRNYLARNFMMNSMKPGDQILFYHSNADPSAIVGTGEVVRPNVADPTARDPESDYYDAKSSKDHPIWFCAEVRYLTKFKNPLTLDQLKTRKDLSEMSLLQKGQRLSVMQVTQKEFNIVLKLAGSAT